MKTNINCHVFLRGDIMRVEELFRKSIHRPINGVVQAGQLDEATIKNELEEYVMTEEGSFYLETFYKNYLAVFKNPSTNIGVWVSGFFGSGKSHFLKILSYLLDNKEIDGKKPVGYFEEKTSKDDLLSMMHEVAAKESDAILFNIDSKSSSSSTDKERIVEVFLRVFNRHLGYSDTLWVAEMERQLAADGKYGEFRDAIQLISDTSWEQFRLKVTLRKKKIIQALVQIGYDEDTATDFFDINRKTFEMNSERLSQLIADYCESRGKEYRLTFLVDEVGQYIGTNSSLMLNLQTVVEDIGNRCKGQAWVIVTSQEKIESSVSNLDSTKDFSKIQGRFATRINLSSANTDEVIKRRLLEKTDVGADTLQTMYDQEEQMIRNRLAFDNKTQLRSGYRSSSEFVSLYPFVPYQVELLQKIFNKIRHQGEGGAHLAHGERSLLKAFQEAGQLNASYDVKHMVTLEEFYPSIRGFLESSITSTIARAEDRARNNEGLEVGDVAVLKVLYLIKGIDEIKATANNIATLLLETIYDERQPLEYRVKESLNRLQQTMFIEQHADGTYSFLSDEEQEINREIRVEDVNHIAIKSQLGDMFFRKMYPKVKFDYKKDALHIPFEFNKRFDNYTKGQMNHPLTMQVYSVFMSNEGAALEANEGHLIICLNEEIVAQAESALKYIEQVQSYIKRKRTTTTTQAQSRIYDEKESQIDEFAQKAEELLVKSCEGARFFIQGQERVFKGSFETQTNSALEMLVKNTYRKLEYVDTPISFKNQKEEWKKAVTEGLQGNLFGETNNKNAVEEVAFVLDDLARMNDKMTVKALLDKFRGIPYGWSDQDTIGIMLALLKDGKCKLTYSGEPFTPSNNSFFDRLTRVTELEKIMILPVVEMDRQVKINANELIRDFFGRNDTFDTYEDYDQFIKAQLKDRFLDPLDAIRDRKRQAPSHNYPYPGDNMLTQVATGVQKVVAIREPEQFVKEFINLEDELETWLSNIEQLNNFYHKSAIQRFDDAVKAIEQNKQDLAIIRNDEIKVIENEINRILIADEPYREIPSLSKLIVQLNEKITEEVEEQRHASIVQVGKMEERISATKEFYSAEESILAFIEKEEQEVGTLKKRIEDENKLTTIRLLLQEVQHLTNDIESKAKSMEEKLRKQVVNVQPKDEGTTVQPTQPSPPTMVREKQEKVISPAVLSNIFFKQKAMIETQNDLDNAIQTLRQELLKELKDHKLMKE